MLCTLVDLGLFVSLPVELKNPNIPRASRVGAHGETAGRDRAGLGNELQEVV